MIDSRTQLDVVALVLLIGVAAIVVWSTAGYFVVLKYVLRLRSPYLESTKEQSQLDICVVVTSAGDENSTRTKIDDCLALDWPHGAPEIIAVVDGAHDMGDSLTKHYAGSGVRVLSTATRRGKSACQRLALDACDAGIVVFTDVGSSVAPGALTAFRRAMGDGSIGCASGVDISRAPSGDTGGEDLYVRSEMALRALESRLGALVGVSGCLFAVRRELCQPWPDELTSDLALPLMVRLRGLRVVVVNEAHCHYASTASPRDEYFRKVRTVTHGLHVVWFFRRALNPIRHPFLALQITTHKLIRWFSPLLYCASLAACAVLASRHVAFRIALLVHLMPVAATVVAVTLPSTQRYLPVRLGRYVASVLLAIAAAWPRFLAGDRIAVWTATRR